MKNSITIFKELFENFIVGLVILNEDNIITHSNNSFQKMIKYNKNDLLNTDFLNYFLFEDKAQYSRLFKDLISGKINSFKIDIRCHTKDRKIKWFNIKVSFSYDDEKNKFIFAILDDISAEKDKNNNLIFLKELAEKTIKVKSEFFANMSHEIRTPIQTIIGMNELLLDTTLDEEQQEYCEQIRFSTSVLIDLINDILDFSKIEAGKLNLEIIDFNIHQLVEEAVKLVVLDAHKKGLEICVNIDKNVPLFLRGDPVRIRQIITNLVNNAVKFTDNGEIEVSVNFLETNNNKCKIKIYIKDTGIGIPEEQLQNLFKAFSQVDSSTTRLYGGTGLGLSISKNLVKLMNGDIGVKSKKEKGSTFWFTILLEKSKKLKDIDKKILKANADKISILLVDDNKIARKITKNYLEECGCYVKEAVNGPQAIKILMDIAYNNKKEFDICLIDLIMPGMDGWQVASEINNNNYIKKTKLILLSPLVKSAEEAKMKLLKWFSGYIYKPIRRSDVCNLLNKVLKDQHEPVELEEISTYTDEEELAEINGNNKKILVADDHEVNQRLFKINLENLGYKVFIVNDGLQAVDKANDDIDMIFMDLHMPNLQGYEAAKIIREKGYKNPIIAITATTLKVELDKCLNSGMDDFLPKPFEKKDLILILKKWFNNSKKKQINTLLNNKTIEDSEIFDFEKAVTNFIGNKEVVFDLIEVFIEKLNNQIPLLKDALKSNDLQKIGQIAHAVKGSSLTLEIRSIGNQAKILEQYAHDGLKEESDKAILIIEKEFEKLKKYFRKYFKK